MREISDWSEPTNEAVSLISKDGPAALSSEGPSLEASPKTRLRRDFRRRRAASDRLLEEDISRVFLVGQAYKGFEEDETDPDM